MPLDPKMLEDMMYMAYQNSQAVASGNQDSLPQLCEELANAIDVFVKSATVKTIVEGDANGGICVPSGPVAKAKVVGQGKGYLE